MSKRFKLLCVAAAVVAYSVVSVAQAAAAQFHAESTPTWLKGTQVTQNVFIVSGGSVKCSGAEFKSVTAISSSPVSSVTVHPTYTGCSAFGQGVSVSTEGCFYTITVTSASTGDVTIECESTHSISVHGSTTGCSVSVAAQTPGSPDVDLSSGGSVSEMDILVTPTVTGIVYSSTGGACGASGSTGTYSGSVTVQGFGTSTFSEPQGFTVF